LAGRKYASIKLNQSVWGDKTVEDLANYIQRKEPQIRGFSKRGISHENTRIGIVLCKAKDDEVVEYSMSRQLNPAMVAQYQLQLPDKKLLHKN
jgi:hypothetical protein